MSKPLFPVLFRLLAAVVFCVAAASAPVSAEPITVIKNVRTNPTVYFGGVPGDETLSREIMAFLGTCGWFDVTRDPKAQYVLSGAKSGDGVTLTLTMGGAPAGSWNVPSAGTPRRTAQHAVDAVIEQTFKELKVKGFCTTKIAFCADTEPGVKNIYMCDIDGGNMEQITNYNTLCVEPNWFPDGRSIGYSKYSRTGIDVVETRLNPKMSRILTSFRGINAGVAISPDGKNMAVILSPDYRVDLYVMPVGGRQPRRLTNSIAVEASPCWSPDGREIAYVSDETGAPWIHIVPAAGGQPRRFKPLGSDAVTPDWSGGGKIVYSTRVQGTYTLAVYDPQTNTSERIVTEPGSWESPAWAADNRQVVCKRVLGQDSSLYVVDSWTGKIRPLASTNFKLSMPTWSKTGVR